MIIPLKKSYPITQIFNDKRYRNSYAKFGLLGHNGVDYGTPEGTEIIAPHDGKIVENIFDSSGYGNYIKIENDKEFSVLAHFKTLSPLKVGTSVKQGDLVGVSGNTGNSTGPHLHWGYCYKPRNKDNGFNGYVDQQLVMLIQEPILQLQSDLTGVRKSRDDWKTKHEKLEIKYNNVVADLAELQVNYEIKDTELTNLKIALEHNTTPIDAKNKEGEYIFTIMDFIKESLRRFRK